MSWNPMTLDKICRDLKHTSNSYFTKIAAFPYFPRLIIYIALKWNLYINVSGPSPDVDIVLLITKWLGSLHMKMSNLRYDCHRSIYVTRNKPSCLDYRVFKLILTDELSFSFALIELSLISPFEGSRVNHCKEDWWSREKIWVI